MPEGSNIRFTSSIPQYGSATSDNFGGGFASGLYELGRGMTTAGGVLVQAERMDQQKEASELEALRRRKLNRMAAEIQGVADRAAFEIPEQASFAEAQALGQQRIGQLTEQYFTEDLLEQFPELEELQASVAQRLETVQAKARLYYAKKEEAQEWAAIKNSATEAYVTSGDSLGYLQSLAPLAQQMLEAGNEQAYKALVSDARGDIRNTQKTLSEGNPTKLGDVTRFESVEAYNKALSQTFNQVFPGETITTSLSQPDMQKTYLNKVEELNKRLGSEADLDRVSISDFALETAGSAIGLFLSSGSEDFSKIEKPVDLLLKEAIRHGFSSGKDELESGAVKSFLGQFPSPEMRNYVNQRYNTQRAIFDKKLNEAQAAASRGEPEKLLGLLAPEGRLAYSRADEKVNQALAQLHLPGADTLLKEGIEDKVEILYAYEFDKRFPEYTAPTWEELLPWDSISSALDKMGPGSASLGAAVGNLSRALGPSFADLRQQVLSGVRESSASTRLMFTSLDPDTGRAHPKTEGLLSAIAASAEVDYSSIRAEARSMAGSLVDDYLLHLNPTPESAADMTTLIAKGLTVEEMNNGDPGRLIRTYRDFISQTYTASGDYALSTSMGGYIDPELSMFDERPAGVYKSAEERDELNQKTGEVLMKHMLGGGRFEKFGSGTYGLNELDPPSDWGWLVPGSFFRGLLSAAGAPTLSVLGPGTYDAYESAELLVKPVDLSKVALPYPMIIEEGEQGASDVKAIQRAFRLATEEGKLRWIQRGDSMQLHLLNPDYAAHSGMSERTYLQNSRPLKMQDGAPVSVSIDTWECVRDDQRTPIMSRVLRPISSPFGPAAHQHSRPEGTAAHQHSLRLGKPRRRLRNGQAE